MTSYGNLLFFYVLTVALLPAILLGLLGRKSKAYGVFITFVLIILLTGFDAFQIKFFLLFYAFEMLLIKGYLNIRQKNENRWFMRLAVLLSILPLIIGRCSDVFATKQLGFIGLSYITFKCVQIIIEIYDGLIKDIHFLDTSYFLFFFPVISSGPIDRSRRFIKEINTPPSKDEYLNDYLSDGIWKIFKGAGYKFIIANAIFAYWLHELSGNERNLLNTINYMYAYSFYLFFDFAGYSLMAIGASYILGVKTPENFNMPFISRDMKDFWNRWHMSLSYWFRDFVYTRFVMRSLEKKRFKDKHTASYIGFLITMVTMGMWHGLKGYYLVYGFYEGMLLVLTDYIQVKSNLYKKYKNRPVFKVASIAVNFHLACFGLLLFSGYLSFRMILKKVIMITTAAGTLIF